MKAELFYDPVCLETLVRINGRVTDQTDIFGFLYPVRRCLLQAWLPPSGSWPGLARQVAELARGEETELVFHGREIDWADLSACLDGLSDVRLAFDLWDAVEARRRQIETARAMICGLMRERVAMEWGNGSDVYKTGSDLFPEVRERLEACLTEDPPWIYAVASEADERRVQRETGCCVIEEQYLQSFERLSVLDTLTRSMRRSADMIVCRFTDETKLSDFRTYCGQLPGQKPRFALAGHDEWKEALEEKYGEPIRLRQQLQALRSGAGLLEELLAGKDELSARIREMRRTQEESPELAHLESRQIWLRSLSHKMDGVRNALSQEMTAIQKETTEA
ncbi:MAG: hypothetical protein IK099_07590 [Clostridia bacterium]|nr:hypothetical protein [Clostridia bacterium]